MEAVGSLRAIDKLGRLVIPSNIRKSFNLEEGVYLEFFTDGDSIIIKKYRPSCIFCKSTKEIVPFKEHMICKACLKDLQENLISSESVQAKN